MCHRDRREGADPKADSTALRGPKTAQATQEPLTHCIHRTFPKEACGFTENRGWRPTTSTRLETATPFRASTPDPCALSVLAGEPVWRERGEPCSTRALALAEAKAQAHEQVPSEPAWVSDESRPPCSQASAQSLVDRGGADVLPVLLPREGSTRLTHHCRLAVSSPRDLVPACSRPLSIPKDLQ